MQLTLNDFYFKFTKLVISEEEPTSNSWDLLTHAVGDRFGGFDLLCYLLKFYAFFFMVNADVAPES